MTFSWKLKMVLLINAALVLPYELLRLFIFGELFFEFKIFVAVLLLSFAIGALLLHLKNRSWTFSSMFGMLALSSVITTILRNVFTFLIILQMAEGMSDGDANATAYDWISGIFQVFVFMCLILPLAVAGLIYGVRKLLEKGAA